MLHQIEDELGVTWFVGKGDPAYEHVQKLHSAHYTWIILPRCVILGQELKDDWRWYLSLASPERIELYRLVECLKMIAC